jgi:hypothetical protein
MVVWAALYATLEISIEGPVGWALAAPTWRMKSSIYGAVMSGKELTGYHLFMFFLPLMLMQLPFVFAYQWGIGMFVWWRELELLAIFFLLSAGWDFWWFVLNPDYTIERFRPGKIWWHAKWIGRVPVDYIGAGASAVLFTSLAAFGDFSVVRRMIMLVLCFIFATLLIIKYAPHYHHWYKTMKERHQLAFEDWQKWLFRSEIDGLIQLMRDMEEIRGHIANYGHLRAKREQIVPRCKGVLVRGDPNVASTNLLNWAYMVHMGGWKTAAVFRVAPTDAICGYRIGYRPSNPDQWIIGKERILAELHTSELFRVRIGREDCTFYAVGRDGKEIPLETVARTAVKSGTYKDAPLY